MRMWIQRIQIHIKAVLYLSFSIDFDTKYHPPPTTPGKLGGSPSSKKKLTALSLTDDWTKADLSDLAYSIPADIELRMKNSPYFQAKPGQFRRLGDRMEKKFELVDATLPPGFRMWQQVRAHSNHKDREFMSPDHMFAFRSRTSVIEYIKLLGKCQFKKVLFPYLTFWCQKKKC